MYICDNCKKHHKEEHIKDIGKKKDGHLCIECYTVWKLNNQMYKVFPKSK